MKYKHNSHGDRMFVYDYIEDTAGHLEVFIFNYVRAIKQFQILKLEIFWL